MPVQQDELWGHITFSRARILGRLADGRTISEIADDLSLSYAGARSGIREIKRICGLDSTRELGRWWRVNREAWVSWCIVQSEGGAEKSS